MPIGIVPWTLRHQLFTAEQVENTYKKLQELGFDGVESGLGSSAGLSADEDLAMMQKYGLRPCSVYCDISKPEEAIATAKKYGVTTLGIPAIPGIMMRRAEGFRIRRFRGLQALLPRPHQVAVADGFSPAFRKAVVLHQRTP